MLNKIQVAIFVVSEYNSFIFMTFFDIIYVYNIRELWKRTPLMNFRYATDVISCINALGNVNIESLESENPVTW